jgi:hypothetical protein
MRLRSGTRMRQYEPDTAEAAEALTIATRLCDEVQRRMASALEF